jgi:hypothetical protein
MLPAGRPFGQSLIDQNFDSGCDGVAVFLQHHHMTVAVNTFLAKIDPGGVDSGLFQSTFPQMAGLSSHRDARLQTPTTIPPLDGNPNGSIDYTGTDERNPIADVRFGVKNGHRGYGRESPVIAPKADIAF